MAELLSILVGLLLITLVTGSKQNNSWQCIKYLKLTFYGKIGGAKHCKPGTRVPADDGCNTCVCLAKNMLVSCTLRDCSDLPKKRHRKKH
uniref:Putative secreted protein n=1 Tax=Panstrongylus lignarius TaxID=156445 RepID=A0A224Y2F8_9HEMI